jgi:predicted RNA-binding protein with PIN domain
MRQLIDGYNVLFAAGFGDSHTASGDLAQARRSLFAFLAQTLTPVEAAETTLVFDAKEAPRDAPAELSYHGMQILFAKDHEEADDLIEELIRRASVPKALTVITSDSRLQQVARRRRAQVISSDDWLVRLEGRLGRRDQREEPPPNTPLPSDTPLDVVDVAQWLAEFGLPAETQPLSPRPPQPQDDLTTDRRAGDQDVTADPQAETLPPEQTHDADWAPFPAGYGDDLLGSNPDGHDPSA